MLTFGLDEGNVSFVSSHVEQRAKIAERMGVRGEKAIAEMLASSCEALGKEPEMVAEMEQAVMADVSRRLVESAAPKTQLDAFRRELVALVNAYIEDGSRSWLLTEPAAPNRPAETGPAKRIGAK